MNINFKITTLPTPAQLINSKEDGYFIYLEGIFTIQVKGQLFFKDDEFTLIEYAVAANKWLQKVYTGEAVDFIYETMGYEEPIFDFIHVGENKYKISSIWETNKIDSLIPQEKIVKAFEKYLKNLREELKIQCNLELHEFYKLY